MNNEVSKKRQKDKRKSGCNMSVYMCLLREGAIEREGRGEGKREKEWKRNRRDKSLFVSEKP